MVFFIINFVVALFRKTLKTLEALIPDEFLFGATWICTFETMSHFLEVERSGNMYIYTHVHMYMYVSIYMLICILTDISCNLYQGPKVILFST